MQKISAKKYEKEVYPKTEAYQPIEVYKQKNPRGVDHSEDSD